MKSKQIVFRLFPALLIACFIGQARAASGPARIAVLVSHQGAPFEQSLAGFREFLNKRGIKAEYTLHRLRGNEAKADKAVTQVEAEGADLILALGGLALKKTCRSVRDTPVIAGMILRESELAGCPNATGVILDIPLRVQFKWLRTMFPKAKTVGVLFNPKENSAFIKAAASRARSMGLRLEARPVNSPSDLPAALESLSNSADVLWGISDPMVLNTQTARNILLFSFRNRIPFVGLSHAWVKAGAFYSLDRQYDDIGRQCGEMALTVLQGGRVSAISPAPPRKVIYSLNSKTAKQMKMDVPQSLIRGAARIF